MEKKIVWFEIIVAIGMITSAVFAIYLKETIASVLSLSTMMLLLSLLYFNLNSPFAAIFQLGLGAGTAAIFLLAGDTLTKDSNLKTSSKTKVLGLIASAILSIPVILINIETQKIPSSLDFSLSATLWDLRAIDVLAQGIVVLTVALGVVIFLEERRRR
jgi:multisubunit Na+/H+ antiporter MnhB subunit